MLLVEMQYERNDMVLEPGRFRVRGDVLDVVPSYENDIIRIELAGNQISKIKEVHLLYRAMLKHHLIRLRFTLHANTWCLKRNMHLHLNISSKS